MGRRAGYRAHPKSMSEAGFWKGILRKVLSGECVLRSDWAVEGRFLLPEDWATFRYQ